MREIDFTPISYAQSLKEHKGEGIRLGGLIVIGVLIAVWTYDTASRTEAAAVELGELKQSYEVQQRAAQQLEVMEEASVAKARYAGILADVGGGVRAAEIVAELSHLLPKSSSIRRLRLEKMPRVAPAPDDEDDRKMSRSASAEEDEEPPTELTITGWSPTGAEVGRIVQRLSRSALFEEVALQYQRTVSIEDRSVVEFQVTCVMPEFE